MLACGVQAYSQNSDKPTFVLPFASQPLFSGNFGEIRATHFHGGLDFKTGGVVGVPIRAFADGYISRIAFTHGSGGILEIVHDNGYTTVSRHIEAFLSPIKERIKELQHQEETYEVSICPEPDEYRVKAGEAVALAGNRGYSFGPHLHLEAIETETGDFVDPLPLFGSGIKDTTPPKAEGFLLIPKQGEGVVQNKTQDYTFPIDNKTAITAWGKVGAAIKAYDYMNGANNRCGVHTVVLNVDGVDVYKSVVDRFSQPEARLVNSLAKNGYMKSFIDPGNPLRLHEAYNDNGGWVDIDEERDYVFRYTLSDASGNTIRHQFIVKGVKKEIEPLQHPDKYFFAWDKANHLHEPGLTLTLPKGILYDDVALNFKLKADSSAIAHTYQLHDRRVHLRDNAEISIGLRRKPIADTDKYYVARVTAKGLAGVGGRYEEGYMKANIRELGTYTVAIDTVPPVIVPINKANWANSGKIVFTIKDAQTGVSAYKGTVDGKYALFYRPNMLSSQYICDLDSKYIQKGQNHRVELIATDGRGNETIITETFFW